MIKFKKMISTIDTHTVGEPTRIVTNGMPAIEGITMMEKKIYLQKKLDWLRKLIINEPRGHSDMFGAYLTNPCDKSCDLGIIYMDSKGYLNMCVHGTIGVVTTAIKLGMIEPKPVIKVDTPAGVVECKVNIIDRGVSSITLRNVPSFVLEEDLEIKLPDIGKIKVDIAFGGSIFAILDSSQFDLELVTGEYNKVSNLGSDILTEINRVLEYRHPLQPEINSIDLVEFSKRLANGGAHYRNAVVFGDGQIDRSPCGTGTCAKMAILHKQGKLELGKTFIHESLIGSKLEGRLVNETKVGQYSGVIPEITGSAWITGMQQFVLEESDPYPEGFSL